MPVMDEPLTVHRDVDLDLPADELWRLISTAAGWREWMVDGADLAIVAGAEGVLTDDGVQRMVRVDEVVDGRSVTFHWCEPGRGDDLSAVRLQLVERPEGGVRLRITEEWLAPHACAECPLRAAARWDLRACVLCFTALASCRV